MASNDKKCPKCSSEMDEGFMLDATRSGIAVDKWLKGHPESSWWQGTKTRGKVCFATQTFRCLQCGFLESYATEEVEPPVQL